ncbi:MAG: hypothetical protein R3193_07180 [Marinobacter sp.]|nr:hypothetical protein [Marinobacter sp.]
MATSDAPLSVPDVTLAVSRGASSVGGLTADGVSGTLANDSTITIAALGGESFGGGPQIANMEDFRGGEGKHLQLIANADERLAGDYYDIGGGSKYYTNDSHSGSASAIWISNTPEEGANTLGLRMTTDPNNDPDDPAQDFYQDVFVSYWMRTPGPYLPFGQNEVTHPGPKIFPSGSNWKMAWLMQGRDGITAGQGAWDNDVVLPTFVTTARCTGNNGGQRIDRLRVEFGNLGSDQDWWEWDYWQRLSFWLSDTNSGQFFIQKVSPGPNGYFSGSGPLENPLNAAGAGNGMNAMNIDGWKRDIADGTLILADDIYWAVGPNCAARVEIGDSDVYEQCSELSICRVDSWSDTEIAVKALFGALTPAAGQTIYVFNYLNQLVSQRTLQNG